MEFKEAAKKIVDLKNNDLKLRDRLIKTGELGKGYHKEMAGLHNHNANELSDIIDSIGYPTVEKVGNEASEAAWLIIQHAIGQPDFMRKCAQLLEMAVSDKKANPINLAYLTDRIATFEGRPQYYGTSFDWDEHGELNPMPYDDLIKVNERRKSVGLNTLEEQILIMRKQAKNENQQVPEDLKSRKTEFDRWRKSVGWIK